MRTEQEIYQAAIDTFGVTAQRDMLIEECAELIQAILKVRRKTTVERMANFCEEFADVEILMAQIRLTLDDTLIQQYKRMKLTRLENLLNQHTDGMDKNK